MADDGCWRKAEMRRANCGIQIAAGQMGENSMTPFSTLALEWLRISTRCERLRKNFADGANFLSTLIFP
jgi:hypothetical protein